MTPEEYIGSPEQYNGGMSDRLYNLVTGRTRRMPKPRLAGTTRCLCGATISANKELCRDCAGLVDSLAAQTDRTRRDVLDEVREQALAS